MVSLWIWILKVSFLGTGKSYVLRILQDILSTLNLSDKVALTAPTGVAACNISGLTIHSWSGLGVSLWRLLGLSKLTL